MHISESSQSYGSSQSQESSQDESESESSIMIKEPLLITGKGLVDLEKKSSRKKKSDEDHAEVINEINTLAEKLKDKGTSHPKYKDRDIMKNKSYAIEIRDVLKNLSDDTVTADSMESALRFILNVMCKTFVGKHELFGYNIDLRGYNTLVMSEIKELRSDTVELAGKVRKSLGRIPVKLFLYFKIFVINFAATIMANNTQNEEHVFDRDFSDEESYESEDDESADESESE